MGLSPFSQSHFFARASPETIAKNKMERNILSLAVVLLVFGVLSFADAKCGQRFHHQKFPSRKGGPEIVGGKDAVRGAYPWQVSIRLEQSGNSSMHFCGGSIIGHHWIVTAAHCINVYMQVLPELFHIVVGDHHRMHVEGSEQVVDIELIIKHESFDANTIDNDIALIKTKQKITYNEYVQPVCLPDSEFSYHTGKAAFISGWGSTEKVIPDISQALRKKKPTRDSPNVLQAAKVPLVNTTDCNATDKYQGLVTENMFCAGFMAGGIDSCQGDSGGPLVIHHQNKRTGEKRFVLAGITSWGVGCAAPNFPGVYTKVANYEDWIDNKINPKKGAKNFDVEFLL